MAFVTALAVWPRSAPRLYLQTRAGVQEPSGGRGRRYWIVSRELCRFFRVPLLPEATVRQQLDALALQIRRLSPFAETGSHFHLGSDFISLWLWDQRAVREEADAIGVDFTQLRVLPETALVPHQDEGVRLVETLDGVEAQCWSKGALAASRWWPALPDDRAWTLFQRGASVLPDRLMATPTAALRLDWLDRPWTRMPAVSTYDLAQFDIRLAALGIGVALLIAYGYLGGEWLRLARDIHVVRAEYAQRLTATEPGLKARTTALDNEAAIARLQKLDRYPGELALMARVVGTMPQDGMHFVDWLFDRGQLQVTVAADVRLDAVFVIRSLERVRGFKSVAAERANSDNSLRIRMAVEPR